MDLTSVVPEDFSGVVQVRTGAAVDIQAGGHADRVAGRLIDRSTRFACASAAKTFTALVVLRLVESGQLVLDAPVAPLVPEVAQMSSAVTVRHLLEHTSGVGDYLDEGEIDDIEAFRLPVPVDGLTAPADLLPLLDLPPRSAPGEPFRYNNSGYVLLAVLAERVGGRSYFAQIQDVLDAAGMTASGFFHVDELPANTALGYLRTGETNRTCLPARGSGDGGIYLTTDDVQKFWSAFRSGELLSESLRADMVTPHHQAGGGSYGWGIWLTADGTTWSLEGMDAGVSFRSTHVPERDLTVTVLANTTSGAWPVLKALDSALGLA